MISLKKYEYDGIYIVEYTGFDQIMEGLMVKVKYGNSILKFMLKAIQFI